MNRFMRELLATIVPAMLVMTVIFIGQTVAITVLAWRGIRIDEWLPVIVVGPYVVIGIALLIDLFRQDLRAASTRKRLRGKR